MKTQGTGWRSNSCLLSDIQPEKVEWLWPGRIPLGAVSMLCGQPDKGKSLITIDLAARITTGGRWPDCDSAAPLGGVVMLGVEDSWSKTVRNRADEAGVDGSRVRVIKSAIGPNGEEAGFVLDKNRDLLDDEIRACQDCRLVVIDPIGAFMGDRDANKDSEVRAILSPLAKIAEKHNVAILCLSHFNKGAHESALNKATGSVAFGAAARAVWLVAEDREQEGRLLFLRGKCNLAKNNGGLAYSIHVKNDQPVIAWETGKVSVSANEALSEDRRRGPRPDARQAGIDFLKEQLADGGKPVRKLEADGINAGISIATLKRAKENLVHQYWVGRESYIRLLTPEEPVVLQQSSSACDS